jgi:hypothetical protein
MKKKTLYAVDATLVFGWSFYRTLSGFYSPSFPWWSVFLLMGWVLLAVRVVFMWNSERNRTRWLSVFGTGLLTTYFAPATIVTIRGYAKGKIIASTVQLGTTLAMVAFVVVCFAVALWDLSAAKQARPSDGTPSSDDELRFRRTTMKARYLRYLIGLTLVIALGWGILRLFSRPMRYEIPGGFKGWFVVQFENESCAALPSQGIFLIVSVPASGNVCTSMPYPTGLVYYRFEYLFPDGTRERLNWNRHGEAGTQVWLVGYNLSTKSEEDFVGDENAMNHSGSPPRLR